MVTIESKINVPDHVLLEEVDGEAVVLNLESGKYYGLDKVGARMWALITQHGQVGPAFQTLLDEYNVSEEQLLQDLLDFVNKLVTHGLLQAGET